MKADLHNHTTASDGELSPAELVQAYSTLGYEAVAITDHDTVRGVTGAIAAGSRYDVKVLPGVEVSVAFEKWTLHLLVYFHRYMMSNHDFLHELEDLCASGRGPTLIRRRVEALNGEFGEDLLPQPLTVPNILGRSEKPTRRHFFQALTEMGIGEKEARSMLSNDSPAYIPSGVKPEAVKRFVKKWPVVTVLAHPGAGSNPEDSFYREVLPPLEDVLFVLGDFLDMGLDGLEYKYPAHTPEIEAEIRTVAQANNIYLLTGGSDCHDDTERPPGVSPVTSQVYDVIVRMLESRMAAPQQVVKLGAFKFAVGPDPVPLPDQDVWLTGRRIRGRLRAGDTIYAILHNCDAFMGAPSYLVFRFDPNGDIWEQNYDRETFAPEDGWTPHKRIPVGQLRFETVERVVEEGDLSEAFAKCQEWNLEWYGHGE
jgi:3',5'-nucleoside bisphosphate phosphatase